MRARVATFAGENRGADYDREIETIRLYSARTFGVANQTSALRTRCVLYRRSKRAITGGTQITHS